MRGHIVQRSKNKGTWSIVIELDRDANGKRKQKWVTFQGSHAEAKKRLTELQHQIDTGLYIPPTGKITLNEYLNQWLKDYCWSNLSPVTAQTYEYLVKKYIVPDLGKTIFTELKPQHLQYFYSKKLSSGLSARTVHYLHTTLHKSLENALKLGIIARNPANAVDSPKPKRHEIKIMSESDMHLLLEFAKETQYYALFYTALFTGLRRSELLALRWSDIDLILCQLSVSRTFYQLHDRTLIFSEPKTAKSRRAVALTPSTVLVLNEHKAEQAKMRESLGLTLHDSDLVFSQYDGKPLLPDSVTQAWRHLVKRTGLKGIRLHDARHTHASLMLKAGVHPKIVQERLG
ncbi:tyrosine-type recombinase/integrase [Chloroflexota bacterium]